MAAKVTTSQSSIQTETAAMSLTITRGIQGGALGNPTNNTPPTVVFGVNMCYADTQYLLDTSGNREAVIAQGINNRWISLTPAQVLKFFTQQITPAGASAPVNLGDFLGQLMDEEITNDLAATATAQASASTPATAAPSTPAA